MSPVEGSLAITVLVRVLQAVGYLGLGGVGGWWLARQVIRPAASAEPQATQPEEPKPKVDAKKTEALLAQLYSLTADVAHGVGEHSSHIAAVGRELNALADAGEGNLIAPVAQAIASLLAANSRLEEQLAHASQRMQDQAHELEVQLADALTDPLTKIANRRAFDRELSRRMPDFKRLRTPLGLVMIDVDYFKRFNDQHGHLAGDEVLRGVARVLQQTVREMDLPARYGGEEFAVVLPASDMAQATRAAERIREAIESSRFEFEGQELRVTASIGMATLAENDEAGDLIKRADLALYASKKAGRNCGHYHNGERAIPLADGEFSPPVQAEPNAAPAVQSVVPPEIQREVETRLRQAARHSQPATFLLVELDLSGFTDAESRETMHQLAGQIVRDVIPERDFVGPAAPGLWAATVKDRDASSAIDIADIVHSRLQQAWAARQIEHPFQLSLGVAESAPSDSPQRALERAQEALAASRERSGSCIHFHTPQTRRPMLADLQSCAER